MLESITCISRSRRFFLLFFGMLPDLIYRSDIMGLAADSDRANVRSLPQIYDIVLPSR